MPLPDTLEPQGWGRGSGSRSPPKKCTLHTLHIYTLHTVYIHTVYTVYRV